MDNPIKLTEKYERNGWPSLRRPDLKPPVGWNLSLLTSMERIRSHALSPDPYGKTIVFCEDIDHAERMRSASRLKMESPKRYPTLLH